MTDAQRPMQKPSAALAVVRLTALVLAILFMVPLYLVLRAFTRGREARLRLAANGTQKWGRVMCGILGLRVRTEGPLPPPGTFIAPNHLGYADLFTVSAAVPTLFVTRTEIVAWPVIGAIVAAAENPHVARTGTKSLHEGARQVAERLKAGQSVCVFLEGTSTGGDRVLPFRTPLLQAVIDSGAPVAPLAIRWDSLGQPADVWDDVAYWTKKHELGSHIFRLAGLRGLEATLRFGEPVPAIDRKQLAEVLREKVCAMSGLPPESEPHPDGYTAKVVATAAAGPEGAE